jgi:hypothetical protein
LLIGAAVAPAPVAADQNGDNTVINLDEVVTGISNLADEVGSLTDNLGDIIVQAGVTLLVKPFQEIIQVLSDVFTYAMVAYPDVKHPDVIELHRFIFQLSLLLAVPVFIWIGFQHMTGRIDGIRPTVELLAVLIAGGLAPQLLYYPVELSRLLAIALRPEQVSIIGGLSATLTTAVIIWLKAIVLLALVILYTIRSFYLLWYVAAAPIIFLLTYFRPTRKYMSSLTGLFIGFLLIAPMDLIAYRLVLALLDMQGPSPVPQYIWGLGGYFVMLALPYQILTSSSSLVLPAMIFASESADRIGDRVKPKIRDQYSDWKENGMQRAARTKNRFLEESPEQVRLIHHSKDEVELEPTTSRVRQAGNRLKRRIRNDQPKVSVEENWRQDENGDWSKESELKPKED